MAVDLLVSLVLPAAEAEVAGDRLWAAGACAVEERPAGDAGVELVAGFPTREAAMEAAGALGGSLVEVDEAVWRHVWRRYAQPVRVGEMTIAPAWRRVTVAGRRSDGHAHPEDAGSDTGDARPLTLWIDPGPCFGSGSHPTTRMMLAALQARVRPGMAVADAGSGSGVLAVAAAALGARRVVAVDLEPSAVEATRRNAMANGLAGRVAASCADVAGLSGTFDVVVANLTAGTLAARAEALVAAVGPGGVLMVSGMLTGQWQHVSGRFAALAPVELPTLEGWCGAVLARSPWSRRRWARPR